MKSFFSLLFGDAASLIFNIVILAALVVLWLQFSEINKKLEEHLKSVKKKFSTSHKEQTLNSDGLTVVTSETAGFTIRDINLSKKEYDEIAAKFESLVQLVPIFPSIGILGTVVGLMLQVSANGIDGMTGAIATALSSTFFALIATIILKAYVAVTTTKIMSAIDIEYRDNDRYHQEFVENRNM